MFPKPCRRAAPAVFITLAFAAAAAAGPPAPQPGTLDADTLVTDVLTANAGLAALEAAVREAGARIEPAGSLDDPMLSYLTAPDTYGSETGDRHMVQISQAVPWPGTLGLRAAAAGRRAEAAERRLAAARLQVAALTRAAYAEWHFVHRALAINADNQALLKELKESAEALYAAGRGKQQDALRAERERARLQHQEIVFIRQCKSVRAQINALLNRPAEYPLPPPGELVEPMPLPSGERLRAAAARHHPELSDLRAQVAAGKAEVGLAQKDFYPDFELTTGYNNMWDERDMRWTVGFGINLPLDRSKRRAGLDAAQAGRQRAEWDLADRRARLLAELETARAEVIEARHGIGIFRDRVLPLARETLNAALAAYRSGAGDFLNVIEAEKEMLKAELELARTHTDYARRLAELERWAGGELPAASKGTAPVSPPVSLGGNHE
jgi:outer membrane protein TolC